MHAYSLLLSALQLEAPWGGAGQIDLAAAEGLHAQIRFFSGFGAAWRHWGLVPEDDMLSTRIIHISLNILLS